MTDKPVCIIPARGGSKRIPKKNIIDFNGKPLIAWSIETALSSRLFSDVVVSTDNEEIAEIAKSHGASVPFMRDAKLSDDYATTAVVLLDALDKLPETKTACCLYPTAPMIQATDLIEAHALLLSVKADSVISVCEFDFPPLRGFETKDDGTIAYKWPEHETTRSQDLPEMLHDAGAFYMFDTSAFRKTKSLVMAKTLPHRIERARVQDIDTADDLELAKQMHRSIMIRDGDENV